MYGRPWTTGRKRFPTLHAASSGWCSSTVVWGLSRSAGRRKRSVRHPPSCPVAPPRARTDLARPSLTDAAGSGSRRQYSYRDLLEIFFTIHDPTTRDRQGNDVGTQYRSVIFFHSDAQQGVAQEVMAELAPHLRSPIVTELLPAQQLLALELELELRVWPQMVPRPSLRMQPG